ncbi:MAG: hypothetical protein JXR31_06940 [Prolixibacteraceae bacterium]|nr:hypothetical protein [Prolixibacteraceae bacterium]MBN2773968.1 hypothetical protein [Prolixibacteraceae bacterium]
MPDFAQIDYSRSIRQFEKEELAGRRYKLGDLRTSLWLKQNDINFGEVKRISNQLPDPRLVIIGEGKHSGFYIYSHRMGKCFKSTVKKHEALVEK